MKKTNKRYLKIIIPLVVLSSIFFIVVKFSSANNPKKDTIVVVGDTAFHEVRENYFEKMSEDEIENNVDWNSYYIFVDNSYFGKYNLYYSDKWYLFTEDRKAKKYDGELFATNNKNIKVLSLEKNQISDFSDVEMILSSKSISFTPNYTSSYYVDFDIDNDNSVERLYVVSNLFPVDPVPDSRFFSLVFLKKDDNIFELYSSISDDSLSGCKPDITNIVDINNDNKYEVVLGCSYYSVDGIKYNIYNFDKEKFNKLVSE